MQQMLVQNFEILIINCIYKINKYKISLLIIIDVINLNILFYVNFYFLSNENIKNFVWVLNVLQELY